MGCGMCKKNHGFVMHPVGFRNPSIIQMYIGADIHSLWSEIDSSRYWIYTKVLSAKLRAHGQIKGCFIMNFKTSDLLQEYKYFELIGTCNHFVKLSHSPNSSLSRLRYSYCYHVYFFLCFFFKSTPLETWNRITRYFQPIWYRGRECITFLARATVGTSLYVSLR